MNRKTIIEQMFDTFREYENIAMDSQIDFMESIKEQYKRKGDLSDKQILAAQNIIDQNIEFKEKTDNSFYTF
jgi:hypothetical protein